MNEQLLQVILDSETHLAEQPQEGMPDSLAESLNSPISDVITFFFENNNWAFEGPEDGVFSIAFSSGENAWKCYVKVLEEARQVVMYSLLPMQVPHTQVLTIAKLVSRINATLKIGNFDFDIDDQSVLYRTSLDIENSYLTLALLERMVYHNVFAVDHYLEQFIDAIA